MDDGELDWGPHKQKLNLKVGEGQNIREKG